MDTLEGIPRHLLIDHPELVQIAQALWEFRHHQPITACCPQCGERLSVVAIHAVRTTWVACLQGCTTYREMHKPSMEPQP